MGERQKPIETSGVSRAGARQAFDATLRSNRVSRARYTSPTHAFNTVTQQTWSDF